MNENYVKYVSLMRKIMDVNASIAVLSWDQEVYMPEKGADARAQQVATLSGIDHELFISDDLGNLLESLSNDKELSFEQKRNVEETLHDYKEKKKYTTEFVIKMSETISLAFQSWSKAKDSNDFSLFAPQLKKVVQLKREECELLGYDGHPYNALLDEHEKGSTVGQLDVLFAEVKKQLIPFIKDIAAQKQINSSFLFNHFDGKKQWAYGIELLKQMNYDFDAGRQDISSHPFTISFDSRDVRITTRINENDFREMIWSCIHEGGHALYEQGLKPDNYGLPSGEAISLGIHESQSRLWENNVGRLMAYWKCNYPHLQEVFPENFGKVSLEDFYKAINLVEPSFIRTAADELTYHFHVIIRYEIEKSLIEGSIEVEDLPRIWKEKYKEYLNIDVPSDQKGVLQDIHWSHGSFGYFPTYSMGSFYAAQFFAKATETIPNLQGLIEQGNLKPLLDYLRENIHQYGRLYTAEEICIRVTGEELNFNYFMDYAKKKFSRIYGI